MNLKISKKWERSKIIADDFLKINSIAFPENGFYFCTGASDSMIYLWDTANCKKISTLKGHRGTVNKLVFDKKSGNLISGSEDMNIFLWNIEYEKNTRTFRGHTSAVNCISVHPVLNLFVSGSRDNTIRIWDLRAKNEVLVIKHHKNQICSVLFNHETPHLISSSKDSEICLWDLVAFKCANNLILHEDQVEDIKLHPCELSFASLCSQTLNMWRSDGILVNKVSIFKNVSFFSFKNKEEFVTLENSGLMKFFGLKNKKFFYNPYYQFYPFSRKPVCKPITMEFNQKYSTFIISSENGKIAIFNEKWSSKV